MNAKYYRTIYFLRQCAVMRRRFTLPFKLIKSKFWLSESYYPELPNHKSRFRIFWELMGHIMRYGSIEWHYFSYGFDVKGFRNKEDYLDDNDFLWKCNMLNTVTSDWDYTCILRDKNLFSVILSNLGYRTPKVLFDVYSTNSINQTASAMLAKNGGGYFCKPFDGQCGGGIFKLIVEEDYCLIDGKLISKEQAKEEIISRLQDNHYIIQDLVEQHKVINAIYDKSINTLRLITIYNQRNDSVIPLSGVLRIGANGNVVDNWAKGGIAVGVDLKTGRLNEYGLYKHGFGTKTNSHPNSGVKFADVTLPYFQEAIAQAQKLHYELKGIRVIGWDIAFTKEGPLFIEGNDNMEVSINQETNGGLKKEFEEIIK